MVGGQGKMGGKGDCDVCEGNTKNHRINPIDHGYTKEDGIYNHHGKVIFHCSEERQSESIIGAGYKNESGIYPIITSIILVKNECDAI